LKHTINEPTALETVQLAIEMLLFDLKIIRGS